MNYKDYIKAVKELGLQPLRIDEFESLTGALDMSEIIKITEKMQKAEKPLGKDKSQSTQQVNTQKQYQIDLVWNFRTMKWLENGMDLLFMFQNLNQSNHN